MNQTLLSPTGRTPQLRIAVTNSCNLRCFFCRPEGEGIQGLVTESLTVEEIAFLLDVSARVGFRHVKFTGGEPLLRKDIVDIVHAAVECPGIVDIQMVTNGILLDEFASALRHVGLSSLTISLDAVSEEVFRAIRGGEVKKVLQGLNAARKVGLLVRINSVITRSNIDEIPSLISIAMEHHATLKLLDLVNLTAPDGEQEWLKAFVPFSEVRRMIENLGGQYDGLEETPGGVGAPLLCYRMPDGMRIVIKDSMFGLYYSRGCKECTKYPCQDAIISLRVTHDGQLKKCLIRNDNLVPLRKHLATRARDLSYREIKVLFDELTASEFVRDVWQPPKWKNMK